MLARLLLILIQLAVCWYAAPHVLSYLPDPGKLNIFSLAAIFAIVVWLVGLAGAAVLKDVAKPTPQTLLFVFVVAAIFAGLTLVPDVTQAIEAVTGKIAYRVYPLVGAVLGYAIQR